MSIYLIDYNPKTKELSPLTVVDDDYVLTPTKVEIMNQQLSEQQADVVKQAKEEAKKTSRQFERQSSKASQNKARVTIIKSLRKEAFKLLQSSSELEKKKRRVTSKGEPRSDEDVMFAQQQYDKNRARIDEILSTLRSMSPYKSYRNDNVFMNNDRGLIVSNDNIYEFKINDDGHVYSPYKIDGYDYYKNLSYIGHVNDFSSH